MSSSQIGEKNASNSSKDLLVKRFDKDLAEVLQHFEIDFAGTVSEVTVSQIMASLGFISFSNDTHMEAVQTIWHHLQPVVGEAE